MSFHGKARVRLLADLVHAGAEDGPDRPLLSVDGGGDVSYAEVRDDVDRMAAGLVASGIGWGSRVAYLGLNGPDYVAVFFGLLRIGAWLVPLNPRMADRELGTILDEVCPNFVLHDEAHADQASRTVAAMSRLAGVDPVSVTLIRALASAESREQSRRLHERVAPDDVAMIKYTSGTTSRPKGVLLRSSGLLHNGHEVGERLGLMPSDRYCTHAPFYHVGGSVLTLLATLSHGACVDTMTRWNAAATIALLEGKRSTLFKPGFTTLVDRFLDAVAAQGSFDHALRLVVVASDRAAMRSLRDALGVKVVNTYGLTEASPNVCHGQWDDEADALLDAVGTPLPDVGIRVREPDTDVVTHRGGRGEVEVAGPGVMVGYFQAPVATANVLSADGWLRTGDLAEIDHDGRLTYLGRLKDTIKSGGENIAPEEVEQALAEHPQVLAAVVIGVSDARWGEVPFAWVRTTADAQLTPDELAQFLSDRLARYKIPKHYQFIDALPYTSTGKVQRGLLREQAEDGLARRIDGAARPSAG